MHQHNFFKRIEHFNAMYKMEEIPQDNVGVMLRRVRDFDRMLQQEIDEVQDINSFIASEQVAEARVAMADWLGDIIVYCASEARRWGIPIEQVLEIIMDSNASKLQADGTALFVDGKLQKGPNYWKPEPKIKQLLENKE